MKQKIGLGLIALIAAATLYYFTAGKAKIVDEMKSSLHQQLTTLQQSGFKVKKEKAEKKREHFVLVFDDPQKIALFFQQQGITISPADAGKLKGLKVAVDATYLPDTKHALAMDIYPIALPESLIQDPANAKQQKRIAHLQDMLKRKALLAHLAIDKLGAGFSGNMKDINETFQDEKTVHFTMQRLTFAGNMKQQILQNLQENLKHLSIKVDNAMQLEMDTIHSDYQLTGKSPYDYKLGYTIGTLSLKGKPGIMLGMHGIHVDSSSQSQKDILNAEAKSVIKTIDIQTPKEALKLENLLLNMKAEHLDLQALALLQRADPNDNKAIDNAMTKLLEGGVTFELSRFSVKKIVKGLQTMDGFDMDAKLTFKPGFNVAATQQNPLSALDKMTLTAHLQLSNDLFAMIAQQPQAMMTLMLFPPQEKNGKKAYAIELKNGQVILNGMPLR
jgi:hypothetical protein